MLMYASVIETMFYLPNRFRHTVMLNTHNIAYVNSESALLSLMSVMFNMQHQSDVQEFKLRQFATCYRLFFACTLPYEALSITSRIALMDKASLKYPEVNSYAQGFMVGAAVQYLMTPFFKLHLGNHNYKIGDTSSLRGYLR